MKYIDWGFLITLVLALVIVGILNRWFIKPHTVESANITSSPIIHNPTTIAGYNDIYHARATSIE